MEKITKITIKDRAYPKMLKKIKDPPPVLYFKGKLKAQEQCFAVVGTRLCSAYGKQATLEITGHLAQAGLTIVSGLAPGIDTFAHQAALGKNGRTIAVVGTGVDEKSLYPKENIRLARKIIEKGGAVISEYKPGTHGSKTTFPRRNRIISGLSMGVLIVEAKQKSGALITADYAKKQNRKIFAVPGSIYSLNSKGPNDLIKKGAILVEKADDILKELKIKKLEREKLKVDMLTEEEKIILEILAEGPLNIEKIIEETKLPAQIVTSTLAIMELEGKIKNLGSNIYGKS